MSINHAKVEQLNGNVSQIDSANVSLGAIVTNNSDSNPEIVEKPTAPAPETYAEKAKKKEEKVPVPIKNKFNCDLCDFSFRNKLDLKIQLLNEHSETKEQEPLMKKEEHSATKDPKSSKKKRNKKKSKQKFNPRYDEDEGSDEMW